MVNIGKTMKMRSMGIYQPVFDSRGNLIGEKRMKPEIKTGLKFVKQLFSW